jgi:hypothetical protein
MVVMNPTIELYELIKHRTDTQTAQAAIHALHGNVKTELSGEVTTAVNTLEIKMAGKVNSSEIKFEKRFRDFELKLASLEREMIDSINSSKTQTILWVVVVGVLQLVAGYLFM